MNREEIILILICVCIFLGGVAFGYKTGPEQKPRPMQVVEKVEESGKCYIKTWIEVSPEEYIGLDIGDEYKGNGGSKE